MRDPTYIWILFNSPRARLPDASFQKPPQPNAIKAVQAERDALYTEYYSIRFDFVPLPVASIV